MIVMRKPTSHNALQGRSLEGLPDAPVDGPALDRLARPQVDSPPHRAAAYAIERELRAWWQAEQAWMRSAGRHGRRRQPAPGQVAFSLGAPWDAYPIYPRSGRRTDHRQAAARVRTGELRELEHVT